MRNEMHFETNTRSDGSFRLKVPKDFCGVLTVSKAGYRTRKVHVNSRRGDLHFDIQMTHWSDFLLKWTKLSIYLLAIMASIAQIFPNATGLVMIKGAICLIIGASLLFACSIILRHIYPK